MLALEARTRVGEVELDVALDIAQDSCVALVGPSGAGKSSILRVIAGLLRPREGLVRCGSEVWLDTRARVNLAPEERRTGMVFQDHALFGHLSALDNVAYGAAGDRRQRRRVAADLLDRLGVGALAAKSPAALSGGERQRVGLARALARAPRVLLLDEPLSALDPRTGAGAAQALAETLRATGVPALMVTHDFAHAATLAQEVAVLNAGTIVQRGSAAQLTAAPASAFVADLTGAIVLEGSARAEGGGSTVVELDGGGVAFSTQRALGRVGLSIAPWEIEVERPGPGVVGSARNRIPATVTGVAELGNRARVALGGAHILTAELSLASTRRLRLEPGDAVIASFKATATRLVALD